MERRVSVALLIKSTDFYDRLPKEIAANLRWRKEILQAAAQDKSIQQQLWTVCSQDPLFWIGAFVWTFNPRNIAIGLSPAIPMIPWAKQDECLLTLVNAVGIEDVGVEKSRDQGASWMCLLVFLWYWLFRPDLKFMMMSRLEDLVDKPGDMDALFQKIEFVIEHLPLWMVPNTYRAGMVLKNLDNGTVITGCATSGTAGAGGRNTAVLIDEFAKFKTDAGYQSLASIQFNTPCRFINSTYEWSGGAYYDFMNQLKKENGKVLRIGWWDHPGQAAGAYKAAEGKVDFIDKNYVHPKGYEFIFDGKLRSPYYDRECKRTPIPSQIARELDIDPSGSGSQFFDKQVIEDHIKFYARDPMMVGNVVPGPELSFSQAKNGKLKLWCNLFGDPKKPFPQKGIEYFIGVDVSAGSGASDSCLSIVERHTGKKVGAYACNRTRPSDFAILAVSVARWFNDATLIWEAQGRGGEFGDQVRQEQYANVYFNHLKKMGWAMGQEAKERLLSRYQHNLSRGEFINSERESLRECLNYQRQKDSIEHVAAATSLDAGGQGKNHGDQVIADALANWLLVERPVIKETQEVKQPPFGSIAWLEQEMKRKDQEELVEAW